MKKISGIFRTNKWRQREREKREKKCCGKQISENHHPVSVISQRRIEFGSRFSNAKEFQLCTHCVHTLHAHTRTNIRKHTPKRRIIEEANYFWSPSNIIVSMLIYKHTQAFSWVSIFMSLWYKLIRESILISAINIMQPLTIDFLHSEQDLILIISFQSFILPEKLYFHLQISETLKTVFINC